MQTISELFDAFLGSVAVSVSVLGFAHIPLVIWLFMTFHEKNTTEWFKRPGTPLTIITISWLLICASVLSGHASSDDMKVLSIATPSAAMIAGILELRRRKQTPTKHQG